MEFVKPGRGKQAPPEEFLSEIVLDSRRDLPLHAQLRSALERLIDERFENGSPFYSENQLIRSLRISQGTVRRALADLASRGLLERQRARGTLVRKRVEGRLRNLAVFLPDFTSGGVFRILGLLSEHCHGTGTRIQPIYTHRGENLLRAYDSLDFSPADGGVILLENSPRATMELAAVLEDKGYRVVVIGTQIGGTSHRFVGGNNASMAKLGLQHLIELGHRRITLIVNEPEEKESVRERIKAFETAAAAFGEGLSARVVRTGIRLWEDSYAAAEGVMDQVMGIPEPPTAIFAISDSGALAAIQWLQRRGIPIPAEVSVLGIGNNSIGTMVNPKLSTVLGPLPDVVRGAFQLLEEKNPEVRKLFMEPSLVVRESTGPVPVAVS